MRGEPAPAGPVLVPPLRVEERDSTRMVAAGHPAVQAAVQYMQANIATARVPDLASAAGISRRHLEQLFRRYMGDSPYDFLLNLRFERARSLLVTSDLPMAELGRRSGFPDPKNFARQFRLRFGSAPSAYRDAQGRASGG